MGFFGWFCLFFVFFFKEGWLLNIQHQEADGTMDRESCLVCEFGCARVFPPFYSALKILWFKLLPVVISAVV